ncbi:uncharacterized protein LOC116302017 isoform X2 [Actinia tenebrosa]|nr:uncharacterized protein LOC116302017 isoform X2 [Actinia tenebrosa]
MNPVQKRPGYLVAKDFKITNVLGNLQGYKIATGQIGKEEVEDISRQYGGDEGAVFGSLITKAGDIPKRAGSKRESDDLATNQERKRRKRKRRRRKKRDNEEDIEPVQNKNTDVTAVGDNGIPLTIPSSILGYGLSGSDSDHNNDNVSNKSSSAASSSSDEEGASNFFGLTDEEEPLVLETEAQPSSVEQTTTSDSRQHFVSYQPYPEVRTDLDDWDHTKNRYKEKTSTLSTYKCWKCKRIGHLPEDCTVNTASSSGFGSSSIPRKHVSIYQGEDDSGTDATLLKDFFKRCQTLRNSRDSKCSTCGGRSNLVSCMDCGLLLCDGRGHLTDHLISYPSHNKLYSFKLRRLIKCCKTTCSVVDATKLLMCSTCLSKQFNSHYDMINAT